MLSYMLYKETKKLEQLLQIQNTGTTPAASAFPLIKKPYRNQHGECILHVACDAFPVCDERYPNRHCPLPSEEVVHILLVSTFY